MKFEVITVVTMKIEVITVVTTKNSVFWDKSSAMKVNQGFGGTYRFHLQIRGVNQARNRQEAVKVEAVHSSENSVEFHVTTRR
jgi:hypothetical protein